jgi:hypothetical protein
MMSGCVAAHGHVGQPGVAQVMKTDRPLQLVRLVQRLARDPYMREVAP